MSDKKIAIMTWLYNGNYGTMLQAYALHNFVKNNGYDVENINYKSSTKTKLLNWLQNRNSPTLFVEKFKGLFGKKDSADDVKRNKNFAEFKEKNIKLSKVVTSPEEVATLSNDYDVFICGSDQIWSPFLMNPVFYLYNVAPNKGKIAYAPSLGVTDTTDRKKEQIKGYLKSFDYVSVREVGGQKFLKNITGNEYPVCLDPTMLLKTEDWNKCIGEPIIKEKYIFCYMLTYNESYVNALKKFADKRNLKVILIKNDTGFENCGFDIVEDAGPEQWLNYIKNAEYVFTDSFHGCIFSNIFHKDFVLFKRFDDSNKKSQNSRIYTLADMLGFRDEIIDKNNLDKIESIKPLDYQKIDSILEEKSSVSKKWLLNALEDVCNK